MGQILPTNISNVWVWEIAHISIIGLIFVPLSIHGIYRYYKLGSNIVIKKRSTRIVLLTAMLVILELLRRIFVFTYLTITVYKSMALCYSCLYMIELIIHPLFSHGLMYSILWRFFVIYYKTNWTQSVIHLKEDLFTNYKSTVGNVHFNGKIFLCMYLISILISASAFQISLFNLISTITAFIIDSCLLVTPSLLLILLWYNTPKINDHFYIRYEMRIIAWITMVGLSMYTIITVFVFFFSNIYIINQVNYYGIISFIGAIQYMSYNITSLYFMVYKLRKNNILSTVTRIHALRKHPSSANQSFNKHNEKNRARIRTVSDISDAAIIIGLNDIKKKQENMSKQNELVPHPTTSNNQYSSDIIIITGKDEQIVCNDNDFNKTNTKINYHTLLQKLLSKNESYEQFVIHLGKEYSIECIFAFTDFVQFKQYLEKDEIFMNEINNINNNQNIPLTNPIATKQYRSMSVTDILNNASFVNSSNHSMSGYFNNNNSQTNSNDIRDIVSNVSLPTNTKRSSIISMLETQRQNINNTNKNDMDCLKIKCKNMRIIIQELCNKYIFGKGSHQINISYSIRSEFDTLIDNQQWINNENISCQQLYCIFDECILEMFQLMTHSLRRFVKTKEYKTIECICSQ